MMIDLTSKVTNMLEDPTLEAIKLTQYVTVLRLMKAPTSNVIHKLISAHQNRSLAIIASFRKRLQILTITFNNTIKTNPTKTTSTTNNTSNNTTAYNTNTTTNTTNKNIINNNNDNLIKNVLNNTTNITDNYLLPETRQFHQELVVGLIEACKGIQELYFITENETQLLQQHSSSSSSNHSSSPRNPILLSSTTSSAEEKLSSPSSSVLDNNNYEQQQQQQYFEKLQAERNQAYATLVTLLSTILLEYKSTLFQSFQLFFTTHQYYHHQLKATYCGML
jgi:hypothetical protein